MLDYCSEALEDLEDPEKVNILHKPYHLIYL